MRLTVAADFLQARLASVAETLIKSLRAKLNSAKTFQAQAQAQAQSFLPL